MGDLIDKSQMFREMTLENRAERDARRIDDLLGRTQAELIEYVEEETTNGQSGCIGCPCSDEQGRPDISSTFCEICLSMENEEE